MRWNSLFEFYPIKTPESHIILVELAEKDQPSSLETKQLFACTRLSTFFLLGSIGHGDNYLKIKPKMYVN